MTGIVGVFNSYPILEHALSLEKITRPIKYIQSDITDYWKDEFLEIARIHHDVINREKQPIYNENATMIVMLVGEIFDYNSTKIDLIRRGHRFRFNDNDAEFCLHLYEEFGQDSFVKLNGSFVLVLYDICNKQLTVVNDRFSSFPMYYCNNGSELVFSTNFNSVVLCGKSKRNLNMQAVFEFFCFQRILGDKTYYDDIEWLLPASILSFKGGTLTIKQYWEMKYCSTDRTEDYYSIELSDRLEKAIAIRTQDSNSIGLLLSGGLDSRVVLAACEKPMVAMSYFADNRDSEIAKRLADDKGVPHIILDSSHIDAHMPALWDECVKLGGGFHTVDRAYMISFSEQIKNRCKIVFHGNPPELFFRGSSLPRGKLRLPYNNYITYPHLSTISDDNLPDMILGNMKHGLYSNQSKCFFSEHYQAKYEDNLKAEIIRILNSTTDKTQNPVDKFTWFDTYYTSRYPSYLFQISLRSFIDERTVFFDNELLDLHLQMPHKFRSSNRVWNNALLKLNPKIANMPDANTGFSPFMPEAVSWSIITASRFIPYLYRSFMNQVIGHKIKRSKWPHNSELQRTDTLLIKIIESTIEDTASMDPSIFNTAHLRYIFNAHKKNEMDYSTALNVIVTFGKWFKNYGPLSNIG